MEDIMGNFILPGAMLETASIPGHLLFCTGFGSRLDTMKFELSPPSRLAFLPRVQEASEEIIQAWGWVCIMRVNNVFQCPHCGGPVDRFPLQAIPFICRKCGAMGDGLTAIMTKQQCIIYKG